MTAGRSEWFLGNIAARSASYGRCDPTQVTLGLVTIVLGYVAVGFAWLTLALRSNRED